MTPLPPDPTPTQDSRGRTALRARPRSRRFHRRVRRYSNLGLRIGLWGIIAFGAVAIARAYFDDAYTLGAFDVPEVLAEAGYSREVVPRRIYDEMLALQGRSTSARDFGDISAGRREASVDVQVAGFGVSFESIAQRLREVTGRTQRSFGGELVLARDTIRLALRQNGRLLDEYTVAYSDTASLSSSLAEVFARAAEGVYEQTEPYLYAVILDRGDEAQRLEAHAIAARLIRGGEPEELPWAYNFLGNRARAAGDTAGSKAYYYKALRADPQFRLGYTNLFATFEQQGATDSMRALIALARRNTRGAERGTLDRLDYRLAVAEGDDARRVSIENKLLSVTERSAEHEQFLLGLSYERLNVGEVARASEILDYAALSYPFSEPTLANQLVTNLLLERWDAAEASLANLRLAAGDGAFMRGSEGWLLVGRDSIARGAQMLREAYRDPGLARYSEQFQPLSALYLAYKTGDTATQRVIVRRIVESAQGDPPSESGMPWLEELIERYTGSRGSGSPD